MADRNGDDAAPILLERSGAVARITLNRPERGNAIDVPLARCLLDRVAVVEADPDVRCVVLRGNGRMFCAGGDVKALHAAGSEAPALLREILAYLHPAVARLAGMAKPVVTAVHGPAAGAGIGLCAAGDIVLAAADAHFTLAYSRIGLTPDGGATWLLPRLIGLRRTQELAMTDRRLPAEEAAAIGLVTRLVAPSALAAEADAVARMLARSAVGALGKTKRLLLAGAGATLESHLAAEAEAIVPQSAAAEGREGLAALVERRTPDFR